MAGFVLLGTLFPRGGQCAILCQALKVPELPRCLSAPGAARILFRFKPLRFFSPTKSMSSDHSSLSDLVLSSYSDRKHKVKYQHGADWDCNIEDRDAPIDLSLVLPHYRARHQPVDHRMTMFVAGNTESIKLKVCRPFPRSKFCLSVHAETANVTVWLPSDFHGQIRCDPARKIVFSAGFVNKILQNVRLNTPAVDPEEACTRDDLVIVTRGRITFRMWDVQSCTPENSHKEALKRLFCGPSSRKNPGASIDWDCLLKD